MSWDEFVMLMIILGSLFEGFGLSNDPHISDEVTANDYSHIHRDTLTNCHLIKDVAMLGAHDAFTNAIDSGSEYDAHSNQSALGNKAARALAGGLFGRMARAQRTDSYDLCRRGIRYFDARASWEPDENDWWAAHTYYSIPFAEAVRGVLQTSAKGILQFLQENPGEFIIFDIQFIFEDPKTKLDCLNAITEMRGDDGKNLWDYVNFDPRQIPISRLSYGDVTAGGTKAGVVVLAPVGVEQGFKVYYRNQGSNPDANSCISVATWHETDDYDTLLAGIQSTVAGVTDADMQKLRINQCQCAPPSDITIAAVEKMTNYWSLLHQGEMYNEKLINVPEFASWFAKLPILITDNVDSMVGDWNDRVIEIINAYNRANTPFCFFRQVSSFKVKRLG